MSLAGEGTLLCCCPPASSGGLRGTGNVFTTSSSSFLQCLLSAPPCPWGINEGYLLMILFPYDPLGKFRKEKRPGTAGRRKGSQGMDR